MEAWLTAVVCLVTCMGYLLLYPPIAESAFKFRDETEEARRPHYALNPVNTKKLALAEESIAVALRFNSPLQVDTGGDCAVYMKKFLHEYDENAGVFKGQAGDQRADIVVENPLLTLRMIRRMVRTLMKDALKKCTDLGFPKVAAEVNAVFKRMKLAPPTEEDLDDALTGLLRIQFVYGLNATDEIRLGNLNGLHTGVFLFFDDILALAKKALDLKVEAQAYQWLISAPLSPPEKDSPPEHLQEDMKELEKTWQRLMKLTRVSTKEAVHAQLGKKRQSTWTNYLTYKYFAVCRGESNTIPEIKRLLSCYSETDFDPYFYINPLKVEVLHVYPSVFQFYDFIKNETIEVIREKAAAGMIRSGVTNSQKGQTDFSSVRTSMQSWLRDTEEPNPDPRLVTLNRRIEKLTGLEVQKFGASNMQVATYGALGGHYDFHNDELQETSAPIPDGDRIMTFLMFLSDVKRGGYTGFPKLGAFARPVKGSAVMWYNLKTNMLPDRRATHGGCPVIMGTKEVANRWILEYANMFKHPCLDEDVGSTS